MRTKDKMKTPDQSRELQPLRSATLQADPLATRILIAPWGNVESTNGSFAVDDEALGLVRAAFDDHGTDLPIDYEHQTLGGQYASPNGQAPAAGWIKRIIGQPGVGIFAEIEWTQQAREMLTAKQYRFLSPVAIIRKSDRKLVAIHSAALTNKPAIVGMTPIVNAQHATHDEEVTPMLDQLRTTLSLPQSAGVEDLLVAASHRIGELESLGNEQHVNHRIAQAMRSGKLTQALQPWAQQLIAKDESLFDQWLQHAPVIVTLGRSLEESVNDMTSFSQRSAISSARAEFRASPLLASLTTEKAYIENAANVASAGAESSNR